MIRRIGLALGLALALVVMLIAAVVGLAQTGFGKRVITTQLSALLTTPDMAVEISGLQGVVPIDMRISRVTAADAEGVWLEVDDLRLAWSPGALLGGRIHIDQLSAARIAVARLPPSEPSTEPAEPIRMPELPTWLPPTTLQQLSVAELDLGPDVLGQPASFALTGHLGTADDGGSANLALDLERTDQATASASVDATLQLEPPTLDLAVHAQETGGLLAALTGRAEAKSFTLELAGQGPLDAWAGNLQVDAEGLAKAQAALSLALADQLALGLDGGLEPAPGVLPDDVAAVLGDRLGFAVLIVQTGPQELKIERLRATAAEVEMAADGVLDFDAERFRADAHLTLADLGAFSGVVGAPTAGDLRLDLTAEGRLLQPSGTIALHGNRLAVAGIGAESLETSIDFAAREPLTSGPRGLALTGHGQATGLAVPDIDPLPARDLSWQLDIYARAHDAIDLNLVRLSAAGSEVTVRGEVDPTALATAGQVDLTVGSLARLTEPFGQTIEGGVALRADFVVAEQARQVEAKLSGTMDHLAGLPPGAAELLGRAVRLGGWITLRPDSLVQVKDLALEGEAAALRGDFGLSLPGQDLDGTLSLSLSRLAVLEPVLKQPVDGALDLDVTLAGSVATPDVQLAARSRDLKLANRVIDRLALLATARGPTTDPTGKVELTVATSGIESTLSTLYALQGQTLKLSELSLVAPRTRVDGALAIDLEKTLIDGSVRGRVDDLIGLAPALPIALRGQVNLNASFTPENGGQTVLASAVVQDLLGDFGRLQRLEARANVRDALAKPRLEANVTARGFRQGDTQIEQVRLNADGTLDRLNVNGSVAGAMVEPFTLDTRAVVALGDAIQVRLEQFAGQAAGEPFRLTRPAEVRVADDGLSLSGLSLELAGARLTADGSMRAKQVQVEAVLADLSLATLADFGAPSLTGQANAHLQVTGPVGAPRGTLRLTVADLRAADPAFDDLPPTSLTADASLADRRLRLDVRGEGVTDKPVVLAAELPVVLQLEPFQFDLPDAPVSGRLDAEIQLARIANIAGLDDDRLEGLLSAALTVGGRVTAPQLDGTVDLANGIYENGTTGTVLHNLTLRARARQQRLTIEELSANDGGTGRLTGQGFVDIVPAASFPTELRLVLTSARLVQTNEADATISGNLAVDGSAAAASLAGALTVDRADIQLPDQVGPSVPTIEVQEVGFPDGGAPRSQASAGTPFDLRLDVVVNLPGRVFVRGRGLESEWEGRIEAKGSAADPRLTGALQIRRGTFELLGQRFDLRRGVITFTGASPPDPTIDIEAVTQAGGITAIVKATGTAKNLTIALTSEPPLPQDEVVSRILFNRTASQITPAQAIQLAAAVNELRGGGPGVLDRLRSTLGVDTLDVGGGGDATAGTTVRAGKYLADGVYVEGETGTAQQSSRARVEVEILPNLSLQAETGADANSGVGVKWKYDY
jgi:translocation and assembly module TamB